MTPVSDVPAGQAFRITRWSVVSRAGGDDADARAALAWLCRAYWEPLRLHAARRGWRDAEDAVQDFWVHLIERGSLASADPARGRFRTWLLACLDHHLADRADAQAAQKRGGGRPTVPLPDDGAANTPEIAGDASAAFDHAWAEALLARARDRVQREGRIEDARWQRLSPFLSTNGDAAAYAAAAAALEISESAVKVAVHRLRERYRASLRAEVADTLADPTPTAIDAEIHALLRILGV